jgi:hypothetical protein
MAVSQRLTNAGSVLIQAVRGRLNRRLLAWFLVLSLAPLFLTNDLAAISQAQARLIDDRIERHLLLLQAITSGNQFLSAGAIQAGGGDAGVMGTVASQAAMRDYLREKLATLSAFDALYVVTLNRRIAAGAGRISGVTVRGQPSATPSVVATLPSDASDSVPHFQFTVPLRGGGGGIVGFLCASTPAVAPAGAGVLERRQLSGRWERASARRLPAATADFPGPDVAFTPGIASRWFPCALLDG